MKNLSQEELLSISGGHNEGAYQNGASFGRNLRQAVDYCEALWPIAKAVLSRI